MARQINWRKVLSLSAKIYWTNAADVTHSEVCMVNASVLLPTNSSILVSDSLPMYLLGDTSDLSAEVH